MSDERDPPSPDADPAIEAAGQAIREFFYGVMDEPLPDDCGAAVVAAVRPIVIRECAEAIEAEKAAAFAEGHASAMVDGWHAGTEDAAQAINATPVPDFPTVPRSYASGYSDAKSDLLAAVRGLAGEAK